LGSLRHVSFFFSPSRLLSGISLPPCCCEELPSKPNFGKPPCSYKRSPLFSSAACEKGFSSPCTPTFRSWGTSPLLGRSSFFFFSLRSTTKRSSRQPNSDERVSLSSLRVFFVTRRRKRGLLLSLASSPHSAEIPLEQRVNLNSHTFKSGGRRPLCSCCVPRVCLRFVCLVSFSQAEFSLVHRWEILDPEWERLCLSS